LGNVFPILSIDGSAEDTDMRRGEGVFSRVMSAQKLLDDHKILHGISIVVSERNQDYVGTEGFVDRIKSDTSILLWYFDFVDVCSSSSVDYGVAPGWDFYEEVKGIQAKKDVFVLYFPYDEFVLDNGCIGAGRRYLHINWNGDVEACFFKHERIDNIRDNDLAEIVRSQVIADVRASTRSRGCDNQACRHLWEYPTGHRVEA
jgi:MoaA/NifB/PqqE/SkfB family radical SAM enzyme